MTYLTASILFWIFATSASASALIKISLYRQTEQKLMRPEELGSHPNRSLSPSNSLSLSLTGLNTKSVRHCHGVPCCRLACYGTLSERVNEEVYTDAHVSDTIFF